MSLDVMVSWIATYHSGHGQGATKLFTDQPDLLAWARAELHRLQDIPQRGMPPVPDPVSVVHRDALRKMIDEFDQNQKVIL